MRPRDEALGRHRGRERADTAIPGGNDPAEEDHTRLPAGDEPVTPRSASVFATAPIGVLVIGALLLFLGAGLIIGGVVLLLSGRPGGWPAWLGLLASGPLAIYLSLHFVDGDRWAWITVVALLLLILGSGVARAIAGGGPPIASLVEVVVSLGCLAYLFRARVRGGFTR
jgi:hypothetical protein